MVHIGTGAASGQCSIETTNPFVGTQSQAITFSSGTGTIGIANQGLNHWGMAFIGGNSYTGCVDLLTKSLGEQAARNVGTNSGKKRQ